MDTGVEVKIIAPESWHQNWLLQVVNVQLLGTGTLSQVKQNMRWVDCIGLEDHRRKAKSYVSRITMILGGT